VPARPRLKTPYYYILLALAAGDRHGLAIARDVHTLSDAQVRLWPATLYGSLEELRENGWIEELTAEPERPSDESERRRYYRITRAGRRVLASETERLAALVRVARSRARRQPASAERC
jgi:DNA-binding PadR family transcriptional regulator